MRLRSEEFRHVKSKHSVSDAINPPVEGLGPELHIELLSPEAMILENREAPTSLHYYSVRLEVE
jgi:hypothetical protein